MWHIRQDFLRTLEAGIVGLFFVQAVRFLYATLYARASSADLVERVPNLDSIQGKPGMVELTTVQGEVVVMVGVLLLPLLALIIGRWRASFPMAVILVALGRSMALQTADLKVPATALVVGAGMLYMALTVIRRPAFFPSILLLGFAGDQIIRALDDTWDRTWQNDYSVRLTDGFDVEMGVLISLVSIAAILFSILVWYVERRAAEIERQAEGYVPPLSGQLNLWSALALGALLYLEFTLLGLPNAVARWSDTSYSGIVPWLLAATTLPLVPEVRDIARRFAGMFDSTWRGWLWALLIGLLLVIGRRFEGIPAATALIVTQFLTGLTLWWLVQTGLPRRNATGLAILVAIIGFAALAVGDYFTYDYAYVRNLSDPYQNVGDFLRAFRGMGLGLALIAALIMSIPMILARRRIPWRGSLGIYTLLGLLLVLAVSFGGAAAAGSSYVRRPINPDCLRVGSYNIHGGYSQFFDPNLERVAQLIAIEGMDVVLLQEIDTGRLASFGVDQVLWLARRLDMEAAFFPQNEALQGIAVLSRVPIANLEGVELPSEGNQAAFMHVTLDPDRLAADPQAAEMGDLHVYNTWLGFREAERNGQPVPEGEQDQNRQLQTLLNWIARLHSPAWTDRIILGGTFNFGPESPLYAALDNPAIQDPFAGLRAEDNMTVYLVDGTPARYDYLWTMNLPLNSVGIDNVSDLAANTSDHRPATIAISRRDGIMCPP